MLIILIARYCGSVWWNGTEIRVTFNCMVQCVVVQTPTWYGSIVWYRGAWSNDNMVQHGKVVWYRATWWVGSEWYSAVAEKKVWWCGTEKVWQCGPRTEKVWQCSTECSKRGKAPGCRPLLLGDKLGPVISMKIILPATIITIAIIIIIIINIVIAIIIINIVISSISIVCFPPLLPQSSSQGFWAFARLCKILWSIKLVLSLDTICSKLKLIWQAYVCNYKTFAAHL